ncbi:MAG: CDP-6-deoxy-delta-3,4-glucoseen reductase [Gammaproteobacteria bacterium]|nr:CDP-6-deoxy-delta-3,4-glucoseen reductase [Gammaproteobacteria bacterium]
MSFVVKIEPSNLSFTVGKNESILAAALRQHIAIPYGCRNGICGSCKGLVLSGEITYPSKDSIALTQEEFDSQVALFCQAQALSDLTINAPLLPTLNETEVKKLPCRVVEKTQLSHDVIGVKLKLPAAETFQFVGGQYIDILLADGRRRSFSIANAPQDNHLIELHIRLIEGGDFTHFVFDELQLKTILRIEGPHGNFFLKEDSERPVILMAGGTGFAPVKSIVEQSLLKGITRDMYLYWGARTSQDLYMHELALQWAQDYLHIQYIPVLSEPTSTSTDFRTGWVHEAILEDFKDLSGFEVYACGPPAMVAAGKTSLPSHQLLVENYFSDAFEFQEPKKTD